jgi:hypothetical protein
MRTNAPPPTAPPSSFETNIKSDRIRVFVVYFEASNFNDASGMTLGGAI